MQFTTDLLPDLIESIINTLEQNAEEVTALDQLLGDGDHVINLQRGLHALKPHYLDYPQLNWSQAWQKIGMTLLSTMGGASGSLFGTLFITMSQVTKETIMLDQKSFAEAYIQAIDAVKKRGQSDAGEKTMLDVLLPVAKTLKENNTSPAPLSILFKKISSTANNGVESTRNMIATKGRASYLQEKSLGHIDAGARTSQLIICQITKELQKIYQANVLASSLA